MWVRNAFHAYQAYQRGNLPERLRSTGHPYADQVCEYEELITASAVFTKEQTKTNFWISKACPSNVQVRINRMGRLTIADLKFIILYNSRNSQSKRLLVTRLRFWEEGSEMRLETHSCNARFYRSGMKMVTQKLEVDKENNIILEARMDHN